MRWHDAENPLTQAAAKALGYNNLIVADETGHSSAVMDQSKIKVGQPVASILRAYEPGDLAKTLVHSLAPNAKKNDETWRDLVTLRELGKDELDEHIARHQGITKSVPVARPGTAAQIPTPTSPPHIPTLPTQTATPIPKHTSTISPPDAPGETLGKPPKDERSMAQYLNFKDLYHGTGMPHLEPSILDSKKVSAGSLFGPGIYLTDNPTVAQGYARDSEGKTGYEYPTVYHGKTNLRRVLDLEQPAPRRVRTLFRRAAAKVPAGHHASYPEGQMADALIDPATKTEDLYRHLLNAHSYVPHSDADHPYRQVNDELARMGYDGLTHMGGGRRGGGNMHRVAIVLDPQGRNRKRVAISVKKLIPQFQGNEASPYPNLQYGADAVKRKRAYIEDLHETARDFRQSPDVWSVPSGQPRYLREALDAVKTRHDPHDTMPDGYDPRRLLAQQGGMYDWARNTLAGGKLTGNDAHFPHDHDLLWGHSIVADKGKGGPEQAENYDAHRDESQNALRREAHPWLAQRIMEAAKRDKWFTPPDEEATKTLSGGLADMLLKALVHTPSSPTPPSIDQAPHSARLTAQYAADPTQMTRAQFRAPPPVAPEGRRMLYHAVRDPAVIPNIINEGLDPTRARSDMDGGSNVIWSAASRTGYGPEAHKVAFHVPEDDRSVERAGGPGEDAHYRVTRPILPHEIAQVDRPYHTAVSGGNTLGAQRASHYADAYHEHIIQEALDRGDPVPEHVRAEYPHLSPPDKEPTTWRDNVNLTPLGDDELNEHIARHAELNKSIPQAPPGTAATLPPPKPPPTTTPTPTTPMVPRKVSPAKTDWRSLETPQSEERAMAQRLNRTDFYHGTGMPHLEPTNLDSGKTKASGLYGPGVYMTDNPTVAQGYAKDSRGKAGSEFPVVYHGKTNFRRVLDADREAPRHVRDIFRKVAKPCH